MKVGKVYKNRVDLTYYQGEVRCEVFWTAWSLVKLDAEGMAKVIEFGMKQADEEIHRQFANEPQEIQDTILDENSAHAAQMKHWKKLVEHLRSGRGEVKVVEEHSVYVP